MTCRQARELISPYLDQQLTGAQMLALQKHLSGCAACAAEHDEVHQVRVLLRSLTAIRPAQRMENQIARRVADAEQDASAPFWEQAATHKIVGPAAWRPLTRPQRGRRLAGALALSCVGLLVLAAPFAPTTADVASTAGLVAYAVPSEEAALGGFLPQAAPSPRLTVPTASLHSFGPQGLDAQGEAAGAVPRVSVPGASATLCGWSTGPLGDDAVGGYAAGAGNASSGR